MNKKYFRIDFIDKEDGSNGFSMCAVGEGYIEDDIIDALLNANEIDKWDVEEHIVNVEDITDDKHEMKFWKSQAIEI